jgi:hypothetical protein
MSSVLQASADFDLLEQVTEMATCEGVVVVGKSRVSDWVPLYVNLGFLRSPCSGEGDDIVVNMEIMALLWHTYHPPRR